MSDAAAPPAATRPEPLFLRVEGAIAELVLNQPARRNAINALMWRALPTLVAEAADNPSVRALIVHGGTAGCFAAGADISEFETVYATAEAAAVYSASILDGLNALENCPKPTIAAIDGVCVGGGCSVALACDIRLASAKARFAITPGKLGLVYSADDTRRLMEAVGVSAAKEMLFTGRMIDAECAASMGLIARITEDDTALTDARALAEEMAPLSPWSAQATKQMVGHVRRGPAAKEEADALFRSAFDGGDFREGYTAFLAKRRPQFQG